MKSLKPDFTTSQDLTLGALDYTTTITKSCKLDRILFRGSVAITETITITLDAYAGASYDTVLRNKSLSAEQSFEYIPQGDLDLQAGDQIRIQCTNANLTGTISVLGKIKELG